MRRTGQLLTALGVLIGIAVSLSLLLPIHLAGIAWLVAMGLVKLTFLAAFGLIGAGAVLRRLANREDERRRLAGSA